MDPIIYLPKDVNLEIHNYLDKESAGNYCRINRCYNELLCNNDNAWKKIFPEIDFPEINYLNRITPKQFLDLRAVPSSDQILERIERLANDLQLGQKGILTCHFPFNPNCSLTVELKFNAEMYGFIFFNGFRAITNTSEISELNDSCIYMKKFEEKDNSFGNFSLNDTVDYPRATSYKFFNSRKCHTRSISIDFPNVENHFDFDHFSSKIKQIMNCELELKVHNFLKISEEAELLKLAQCTTVAAGILGILFKNYYQ